jgi:3-deoxy-7-phosphoheptulonate synthase
MQESETRDVNVMSTVSLLSPIELVSKLPLSPEVEETVLEGRKQIQGILRGEDGRFLVITGPCSIHDETAALEYAERLAKLSSKLSDRILMVMRVYFEKPRTTVGWKGLLYDPLMNDSFDIAAGLERCRKLLIQIAEMGVHTATEFLDPIVPQYLGDLVTWAAIGARTTESQTHRQMASALSMPVGFKNGTDGGTQISVDAMMSARSPHGFLGIDHEGRTAIIHTAGNAYGHLVLRGGNDGPNFGATYVAEAQEKLEGAGLPSQLLVDCSHGNCSKDHTKMHIAFRDVVQQRVDGNAGVIGSMLESNLHAGNQKLDGDVSGLKYGVSITDPCIDWEETDSLLSWAYDALGESAG